MHIQPAYFWWKKVKFAAFFLLLGFWFSLSMCFSSTFLLSFSGCSCGPHLLGTQVTSSPLWNSSFMAKTVSNTHEIFLVMAMAQHPIPNCPLNYTDSYFILAPSLLSTLFAVLVSCTSIRPLFLLSHFVTEAYVDMELLFSKDNWMDCLQKTHFRLLLHVHEASKDSDWKHRVFSFCLTEECMAGRKKDGTRFGVPAHRHQGRAESLDPSHSCARIERWLRSRI